jgi:hypothetical protein
VLRDYKRWADKFFRRVAGKPPKGLPAPVPVSIFAKDASDRMFGLSYWVFLDLPSDRFESHDKENLK